ncbi:MAG: helix-turn-helix transcriptional regulator [Asgard group archaeon]|nr:helix-turn-helix transcriptional regulator [Asgard group archaeon]
MSLEESKKKEKKVVKIVVVKGREEITDLDEIIEKIDLKQICCVSLDRKEYLSGIDVFEKADNFSTTLKLIANPIRLKILLILLNKEWACNCEFESAFSEHQTLISHHLRNLREGGLITFKKKGKWKFYKLKDEVRPFLEKIRELIYIMPEAVCC